MPKNFLYNVRNLNEAEDLMSTLFQKGHFVAQSAEISYNRNQPKKQAVPTLILTGFLDGDPSGIYLYLVSDKYDENTPESINKILKMAGFVFDQNDLLTDKFVDPDGQVALSLQKK